MVIFQYPMNELELCEWQAQRVYMIQLRKVCVSFADKLFWQVFFLYPQTCGKLFTFYTERWKTMQSRADAHGCLCLGKLIAGLFLISFVDWITRKVLTWRFWTGGCNKVSELNVAAKKLVNIYQMILTVTSLRKWFICIIIQWLHFINTHC